MTHMTVERLGVASGRHAVRAFEFARERAVDALAGRTVWNATALPGADMSARLLRGQLELAGEGVAVGTLEVSTDDPLHQLAKRVDAMLGGEARTRVPLGHADQDAYREGVRGSDALVGEEIGFGDVVVMHDPLVAMLAQAIRERGAHAVWHVRVGPVTAEPMAREARAFLKRFTASLDAYVTTTPHPVGRGVPGARITALMPAPDAVAAKDLPDELPAERSTSSSAAAAAQSRPDWADPRRAGATTEAFPRAERSRYAPVGWCCLLADVVLEDRDERVGGRLHPRPTVAAR